MGVPWLHNHRRHFFLRKVLDIFSPSVQWRKIRKNCPGCIGIYSEICMENRCDIYLCAGTQSWFSRFIAEIRQNHIFCDIFQCFASFFPAVQEKTAAGRNAVFIGISVWKFGFSVTWTAYATWQRKSFGLRWFSSEKVEKLRPFTFIVDGLFATVCPAKLDHTCRCKSGHGNRQWAV